MKIGLNMRMVKEFSSYGRVRACEVDLIEISLAEIDFIVLQKWVEETARTLRDCYGVDFTLHAPA